MTAVAARDLPAESFLEGGIRRGREIVDLNVLRAEGERLVGEGLTPSEAARAVLERLEPNPETKRELVLLGLTRVLNNDLGSRRTGLQPAHRAVVAFVPPPGGDDPLHIPAQTLDGVMHDRIDWTIADWRAWEHYCKGQANAWFSQQDGSREIVELLEKARVERIRDLPPAKIEQARRIVRGFRA